MTRPMDVEKTKQVCQDRGRWKSVVFGRQQSSLSSASHKKDRDFAKAEQLQKTEVDVRNKEISTIGVICTESPTKEVNSSQVDFSACVEYEVDVTNKEISTLDIVSVQSPTKEVASSDTDFSAGLENKIDVTPKEILTLNVVSIKSPFKEVNSSDNHSSVCIENQVDGINEEIFTLDVEGVKSPAKQVLSVINTSASKKNELDVIDKETSTEHQIEIAQKSSPRLHNLEGRRIVNILNLFSKLKDISSHSSYCGGLSCVDIIAEKKRGLQSIFTLKCKLCNETFYISSDEGSEMDINNCAVLGTVAIGSGHSQLQELCAALDLPLMYDKMYKKSHERIAKMWESISVKTMNDAAKEEKEFAILEGRIDENGVPIIDVIVDGCWSKRSYKKNYSALSGAAGIIGKRTGKILYLGVRNKYCCICARAQHKKETPFNHKCYKNYSGPSTGMESHILVEGFKSSIEMHGLIYGRMISDGDSSTYSKIIEARPYPHLTVQKIECKNHIMRNMCNKLAQLKTDTKYPPRLRKNITDQKILSIRGTIKKVMEKYTSDSETEKRAHIEPLYNDILLAHIHSFGDHGRCKTYFCKKTNEEGSIDHDFITSSLWSKICQIMSNVASHAPSLIHNVESNKIENYNSKIAKLVGGKRVNYSLRGGYESRCKGAAISHNTRALLSKTFKHATGNSPRGKMKLLEERRLKRCQAKKKYTRSRNKFLVCKGEDLNYGENCAREDISPEIMDKEKVTFLNNLQKTEEERERIEKETILQSASSEWLELRRKLLTASNFGRVVKRRSDISCSNLVKDLLYKDCISHIKSIKHGANNEKIAIEQLSKQEGVTITPCGLFIDEKLPYLGASPDGICEDMAVEIKCPISAYQLNFDEAVRKKKIPFYKQSENGNICINTKHNWYYQIQGQLHITKKSKSLFGLWQGETLPMRIDIIEKDDKFWHEEMEDKLTRFYMNCILPEIIDPRYTRKMAIRDPIYIKKAMENKPKKKTKMTHIDIDRAKEKENTEKKPEEIFPSDLPKTSKRKRGLITENNDNKRNKINENEDDKENRDINFNYATDFPNIAIQEFGETSDDEEVHVRGSKMYHGRQLNFSEF